MEAKKLEKVSLDEYLQLELETQTRYEYRDGLIEAMAGGTLNHGFICGNVFAELRNRLKDKDSPCRALSSEIKLHIRSENSFLYPDAMVVCGPVETSTPEGQAIVNPQLIVEVLSKTTADYDRGDKFFLYRQLPSLREYVLIEQDRAQVDVFRREGDWWKISRLSGSDAILHIGSLGIDLPLQAVYEGVNWD
jgi:Uma2 family endonuclease